MNEKQQKVNDVLSVLDKISSETTFDFYVPSLNATWKSKELNTEQLKRLFKSLVDSPLQNAIYTQTINEIIRENVIDGDYLEMTTLDKFVYTLTLRVKSVSPEYKVSFTKDEIDMYKLTSDVDVIDLAKHVENVKNVKHPTSVTIDSVSPYEVVCSLPTIKVENQLEEDLHKNLDLDVKTPEELRNIIGETFINEISKYIQKITMNDVVLDLSEFDFKSRISFVAKLPTTIINRVLKYMESCKTVIDNVITVSIDGVKDGKSYKITRDLPFDASFFNE